MEKPTIFLGRALPVDVVDMLRRLFVVVDNQADRALSADDFAAAAAECHGALITPANRVDAALLARCPRLRVVSNIGVGYDHVDVAACTARSVLVTNTPGVVDGATADLTWALILAACRRVVEADAYVRAGEWPTNPQPFLGQQVHGATLGILGFGRIGQAVARRAAGFDMTVLYHQPRRVAPDLESACRASFVGRDELLQRCRHPDAAHAVWTRHAPRDRRTRDRVDETHGRPRQRSAWRHRRRCDMIAALGRGAIAAAGLDVFENEPRLDAGYASLRNVVLTPHIGSATMATRVKMVQLAIGNLVAALTGGAVPAPVNPAVLPQRKPA